MERTSFPVFYQFYNPPVVPLKVLLPLLDRQTVVGNPPVGARIVPATQVINMLAKKPKNQSPTLADMTGLVQSNSGTLHGWRLEDFFADLLLGCSVGKRVSSEDEEALGELFFRRSGPIAAAIAVTVEIPETAELPE